jgi:nitrite reductase (NADH) small subunit
VELARRGPRASVVSRQTGNLMTKTMPRLPLCVVDDIPVGLGRGFEIDGKSVAVFRTRAGKIFAVHGICPHKGAPLADGMIAGEQVVCPYHNFRFHSDTGECDQANVCSIATYPVDVKNGQVFVTV